MKIGDQVEHIPLPNGATLGKGTVIEIKHNVLNKLSVLVSFHNYKGKMNPRWMVPETLIKRKKNSKIFLLTSATRQTTLIE
jgi:7-keto-8-aminopelargonate synthetase-like enzyme